MKACAAATTKCHRGHSGALSATSSPGSGSVSPRALPAEASRLHARAGSELGRVCSRVCASGFRYLLLFLQFYRNCHRWFGPCSGLTRGQTTGLLVPYIDLREAA